MEPVFMFTGPKCSNCVAIKPYLNNAGIHYVEIDTSTTEGGELAKRHNVRSLPSMLDRNGKVHHGIEASMAFARTYTKGAA